MMKKPILKINPLLTTIAALALCGCDDAPARWAADAGDEPTDGGGLEQGPLTVRIENRTADDRYLRLTEDLNCRTGGVRLERRNGASWEALAAWLPLTECFCDELEEGGTCDCEGDYPDPVTAIAGGDALEIVWSGTAWWPDEEYLAAGSYQTCFREHALVAGTYRFVVEVFAAVEPAHGGEEIDLEPDEDGKIPWALPSGEPTIVETEFALPSTGPVTVVVP